MKKLLIITALAVAFAAHIGLFTSRSYAAGPWYVSTTGNDANDCLSPATACLTLQAAINKASPGDTINVAAGTYTVVGVVGVSKTLNIKGAQAGVDARTRAGAESILENSGGLYVTANDVIIDGFTVQNSTAAAFTGYGIALGAGTSGGHVINNIIQDNIAGVGLANNPAGNQAVIQYNLFRNNTRPGSASGHGIYSDQFVAGALVGVDDVLIDSNDFVNDNLATTGTFGIGISNTGAIPFTNLQIQNNRFDSASPASRGMYFFNTDSSSIKGNSIKNKTNYAIRFIGGNDGITIQCNTIENSNRGIHVSGAFTGPNSNITANDNNISGNATAGLEVVTGTYSGGAGSLNAENNWWGSATGPTIASNPGGTGDNIIDPDGVVDYSPFRTAPVPDADNDGTLDPCDALVDSDGDGISDGSDNCPSVPNPGQEDADGDGVGNVCDSCPFDAGNDADGDGVCGDVDNCPSVANPSQTDSDGDGLGNACDACPLDSANDVDGDGVCGNVDNCPTVSNPGQQNFDGDGQGDACDNDDDNDGVPDATDQCPNTPLGTPVSVKGCPKAVTADQCKKDGWKTLQRANGTTFKNQGDCMQYVNTGK